MRQLREGSIIGGGRHRPQDRCSLSIPNNPISEGSPRIIVDAAIDGRTVKYKWVLRCIEQIELVSRVTCLQR